MDLIAIDEIEISADRQRKVFNHDALGELADSIKSKGLMHAICLQADADTLIAGERRIKAIEMLYTLKQTFQYNGEDVPVGFVPCIRLADMSEDMIYEAELEENVKRQNLTPQEEMQAIAKLHAFRVKQRPNHTKADTAKELEIGSQFEISEALLVADNLNDPAVARAKTKQEAVKAVKKKIQREYATQLAETFKMESSDENPHSILKGDAIENLRNLPELSFDCICTDPPYGIEAQAFGTMADNAHNYDDTYATWKVLMKEFADESYRIAKAESHLYAFCSWERFAELSLILAQAGWTVWTRPLIWSKGNGMLPKPKHGPRYTYETLLFASKGNKETLCVSPDVIKIPLVQDARHAAEKPVDLYVDLLKRSCLPGDTVIDPFMGSGTIFPAANELSLRATGIEKDSTNYGIAIQRLEERK